MTKTPPQALILYSNPPSTSRLTLDREHRALDRVLTDLGLPTTLVQRLHAVSAEDLAQALQATSFEILHFSGHGSPEGVYLENEQDDHGELVDARRLMRIIEGTRSRPRALLFLSCFSSDCLKSLSAAAPFIVTVAGKVADETAIEFVRSFYREYFSTGSIERAFAFASSMVDYLNLGHSFYPVLTRRGELDRKNSFCAATFRNPQLDSLLIDLSRVDEQINRLTVSREEFLSLVSRKIRIHRFIFDHPSEKTILSIGPYFAEFSWQTADDPIACHRILRLREDSDEKLCETWADLIVSYNDLTAASYRNQPTPAQPQNERRLRRALEEMHGLSRRFFLDRDLADRIREVLPSEFKVSKSLVLAHLRQGDSAFHRTDFSRVVVHLESVLTAVHDLVDALADVLTSEV